MLKEFKPTILFLLKFALIFGIGSISYSYYVKQYNSLDPPTPDPVTELVGVQTYNFIKFLGYPVKMWHPISQPTVGIFIEGYEDDSIGVFEGCNGVNIGILFIAFIVAFGGSIKRMLWFIPLGIISIHIFNILRLSSLTIVATYSQSFFHFFHKYAFTGIIYVFVLILWVIWVKKLYVQPKKVEDENS